MSNKCLGMKSFYFNGESQDFEFFFFSLRETESIWSNVAEVWLGSLQL